MDKKNQLVLGLMVIMAITIFLTNPSAIKAQECQIVRIYGQSYPQTTVYLEPATLLIPKGGCVVWFNSSPGSKVKVNFREGKKCQDVTSAPTGFKMDHSLGCYLTDFITFGGTSSLKFNQEGTFKYEVEMEGAAKKVEGSIVIVVR